jgi:hypothetical protein
MSMRVGIVFLVLSACTSNSGGKGDTGGPQGGSSATGGSQGGSSATGDSQGGSSGNAASQGGSGGAGSMGSSGLTLPQVYPPVRAATPTALIADPSYSALAASLEPLSAPSHLGTARQALGEGINLGTAIQERFYSAGPTNLLRIVKTLDDRVQGLDVDPATHDCLNTPPVPVTYVLPGGQTFEVKLQCMQHFGTPGASAGWVGFGFERSSAADAGTAGVDAGNRAADAGTIATDAGPSQASLGDFYLIEGQEGGNGGAYHIDASGNVEAWIAVAERDIPTNSQVIMHLLTHEASGTLELALAGSGVGFCAAHLKTNPDFLFVDGKTNAPPPPGTEQAVGTQYCDEPRSGCFQASDLDTDLGSDSPSCAGIAASSFDLAVELDADTSPDAGDNVVTSEIYSYFNEMPTGVPEF